MMTVTLALLILLSITVGAAAQLPQLAYRYAVFYAPQPQQAANFLLQFVNATAVPKLQAAAMLLDYGTFQPQRLQQQQQQRSRSESALQARELAALRLPFGEGAYSEFFFGNDPALPGGKAPPKSFAQ